jgi:hypothetical protein
MAYERMGATFSLLFGCFGLLVGIFFIFVYWKIFSKAGFNGAMSLLLLVPIANLVVICMLAFGKWPVHEELERLRMSGGGVPPYQPPFPPQPPYPPQSGYPRY